MSTVTCTGGMHIVTEDIYPGGIWTESTEHPYRVDVVEMRLCDCEQRKIDDALLEWRG